MKNMYKIATFIVLLSLAAFNMKAQLSGAYTINSAIATGGTNYQSFTDFATAVNASGVSGPVTVNVVTGSGPYNEQVIFNAITGTSATNSITINGNNCTITFAGTVSAPHTIGLNGADYMFFNNLNMIGTGTTYALVCHLWNVAENNQFLNCTMTAPANGTSSSQIPFSLSGSSTSGTSSGNSGNNNIVNTCTLNSGYYNCVFYGNSGTPVNTGNQVINSQIRDFYFYGVYNYYCNNTTVKGNTIERVNRTTISTGYGVYAGFNGYGMLIDGNRIRRLFDGTTSSGSTAYCIYLATSSIAGSEIITRNNVISDIRSAGSIYAIYNGGYNYHNVYHNTVSLDDQTATTTSSSYGIMSYGTTACNVRNNLVSITRGGGGTKVCLYLTNSGIYSNNNVLYINAPAGTNYIGYNGSSFYTTLASWQAANGSLWDQASMSANPNFANPTLFDYTPTTASINNLGAPLGVLTDVTGLNRNLPAPDAGAYEFFNQPCATTPGANSVVSPTYVICPNANASISLLNTYTVNGISYQWGAATSSVGPFTAISGATLASYITPTLSSTTWYSATLTCANGGTAVAATPAQVQIATTVTNTVPYYEGFEGITGGGKLPNCSWAVSNTVTCLTYNSSNTQNRVPNTGNNFASFYYTPAGSNYFYTNGIQLNAGVTYSAAMWFTTEYYGYNTYSLTMAFGQTQSPSGLTTIATSSYAASPNYKLFNNTFTVPTSGIYYIAVNAVSNGNCCGYYLSWDDLSITIPCDLNTPTLSVGGTSVSTICAGQPVGFTATGANTYSWSTGATTSSISATPMANASYVVVGTNTASGCSASVTKNIAVNPSPQVSIFVFNPNVCEGSPVNMNAVGASNYTWIPTGGTGAIESVTATSASPSYTVIGSNSYGCTNTATTALNVNQLPSVNATSSNNGQSCPGVGVTLTASGPAVNYQWTANSIYLTGNPVVVSPVVTTTYVVTGTDASGCTGTTSIVQQVVATCVGINEQSASIIGLSVYPNPSNGEFVIELANGLDKTVEVSDITGRTIAVQTSGNDKMNLNISNFANGVYYVKVKTSNTYEVLKMVKQ